jgi:DNA-binding transcriptional LysR family regulator
VRQRLQRCFMLANLAEPLLAVETDSLSLMLATLRMTDCLALTTTQILAQAEAQGIVALDHEQLQFSREAGIVSRRHADVSPAVKLIIAQVRKIAAKYGPN